MDGERSYRWGHRLPVAVGVRGAPPGRETRGDWEAQGAPWCRGAERTGAHAPFRFSGLSSPPPSLPAAPPPHSLLQPLPRTPQKHQLLGVALSTDAESPAWWPGACAQGRPTGVWGNSSNDPSPPPTGNDFPPQERSFSLELLPWSWGLAEGLRTRG